MAFPSELSRIANRILFPQTPSFAALTAMDAVDKLVAGAAASKGFTTGGLLGGLLGGLVPPEPTTRTTYSLLPPLSKNARAA